MNTSAQQTDFDEEKPEKGAEHLKKKGRLDKFDVVTDDAPDEIHELAEEKADIEREAKSAIALNTDETLDLLESNLHQDEKAPPKNRDVFKEFLGFMVETWKEMKEEEQVDAYKGMKKTLKALDKKKKGGKDAEEKNDKIKISLTPDEKKSLLVIGIYTLRKLRRKYGNQAQLAEVLTRISDTAANTSVSNYPLIELFRVTPFDLFTEDPKEAGGAFDRFGLSEQEKKDFSVILQDKLSNEDLEKITKVLKAHFFPHTSEANIKQLVAEAKEFIKNDEDMDPYTLAKLLFLVDDADYQNLMAVMLNRGLYAKIKKL